MIVSKAPTSVAVVGNGVVGARVVQHLMSPVVGETDPVDVVSVSRRTLREAHGADVVVLAHGGPHAPIARTLLGEGCHVVSVCDDLDDTLDMLNMHAFAVNADRAVVTGASCSPGMTALLVNYLMPLFDTVDEVHVAVHGTGGPDCARQHHRNLAGVAVGWHDEEWIKRPAGSGRELCWFPDPVNARDCYRYATPEPVVLQRVVPGLQRITARCSATRRDRLTARLPMLTPPHAEGGVGALRVEVRGRRDGLRHVEVIGLAEKIASVAAAVAAHTALGIIRRAPEPGVHVVGESSLQQPNLLDAVLATGVSLHQFVGG